MTTSSQQPDYSTILSSDTVDVVTITSSDCYYSTMSNNSTVDVLTGAPSDYYYSTDYSLGSNIGTITLTGIGSDTISFPDPIILEPHLPKEFVDTFPTWDKVEKMCKEYPGLDIALKKFQEVYKMVEDDWQAKQGQKYGNYP